MKQKIAAKVDLEVDIRIYRDHKKKENRIAKKIRMIEGRMGKIDCNIIKLENEIDTIETRTPTSAPPQRLHHRQN